MSDGIKQYQHVSTRAFISIVIDEEKGSIFIQKATGVESYDLRRSDICTKKETEEK